LIKNDVNNKIYSKIDKKHQNQKSDKIKKIKKHQKSTKSENQKTQKMTKCKTKNCQKSVKNRQNGQNPVLRPKTQKTGVHAVCQKCPHQMARKTHKVTFTP